MARRKIGTKLAATGLRLQLEGQVTLMRLGEALDAWTDLLREPSRETPVRGR